jgi:hypothetical protein
MSSVNPATPFTPGYNPQAVQPQRSDKIDKAAEKARQSVNELTGTAVAAEATKDRLQGAVLDIRV